MWTCFMFHEDGGSSLRCTFGLNCQLSDVTINVKMVKPRRLVIDRLALCSSSVCSTKQQKIVNQMLMRSVLGNQMLMRSARIQSRPMHPSRSNEMRQMKKWSAMALRWARQTEQKSKSDKAAFNLRLSPGRKSELAPNRVSFSDTPPWYGFS